MRLFKRRDWSKYVHIGYVEDYTTHKIYSLLKRVDANSGDEQYKRVLVFQYNHELISNLNSNSLTNKLNTLNYGK